MEIIKLDPPLKLELPDECSYERILASLEEHRKAIIKNLAEERGISVEEMKKIVALQTEEYNEQEIKMPNFSVEYNKQQDYGRT